MPFQQIAKIILEDGTEIIGKSFGAKTSATGEVVFNTAMTGYPESLSDPSYTGQILTLTFPLIGNYGVPKKDKIDDLKQFFESDKVHISGLIVSNYSTEHSHWNAQESLSNWLIEHNIPAIFDVDTRALTEKLRDNGTMLGKIIIDNIDLELKDPNKENLVDQVSIKEKKIYGNGKHKILLIDCGVKNNILRCLLDYDTTIIRVPWDYDYSKENYDGIFISNGPGDPEQCEITIQNIKKSLLEDKPIFGICLGNQLMGLAAGAKTFKLKYGHRSHNQPVILEGTKQCFITSQNHGFALDTDSLPKDWKPLFTNLNDGTCEGIQHKTKPFYAAQFHPEASGGPNDTKFFFEWFLEKIKNYKK